MPVQTNTTTNAPPAYLQPYLEGAAGAGTNLYNQGPPQYYPGQSVVPFSTQTNQAMNLQQQRALQGSPLVDAAQGLNLQTLQGGFLNSNPYLDATFDQAAAGVNRSLDTTLARGGRDVNANMGARQSGLNELSNQIYGGNYQMERDRQMGAMNSAAGLAREDYFDIGQLGQVGAQVEQQAGNIQADNMARWDYAQNAPWENLNRYMGVLSGAPYGGTTTQTTPYYTNPWGSALGGALAGGSQFGGWGALAGGLLGYLGGR